MMLTMAFDAAHLFDAISTALDSVDSADGAATTLNETETRTHLIDPVLAALGYETLDQVRREVRLEASGQIVDYQLHAGDQQVVVEAKASRVSLDAKEASQLVGYCAQEGVRWALLSNGLQWQIFDVELSGNWEAKRIAKLDLEGALRSDRLAEELAPLEYFALATLREDDSALLAWAHEERARRHLDRLTSDPTSPLIASALAELEALDISLEPEDVVSLLRHGTSSGTRTLNPPAAIPAPPSRDEIAGSGETSDTQFFVFPARHEDGVQADQHLRTWLDAGFWGVSATSANRKRITTNDVCCFYAKGVGIIARAVVTGPVVDVVRAHEWPGTEAPSEDVFRVPLRDVVWLEEATDVAPLRPDLDAFRGKDLTRTWGWFVQSTGRLSEHDFKLLTAE